MVHLPVVGLLVAVGGVAGEFAGIYVQVNLFLQPPVVHQFGVSRSRERLMAVVGDDIDDPGDGFAAVEGTGCAAEDFNPLDVGHVDAVPAVVAADALAVLEDDDIVVAHTVDIDKGAHAVGVGRDVGRQPGQGFLQVGGMGVLQIFRRDDFYGHRRVVCAVVGARSRHHHGIKYD